jgi:tetratricopeptide (TPR) repeat protein
LRQAIVIYQDLLRAAPRDADLMQRLGVAFAQLGAHDQGAQMLAASLEVRPDQPKVLLNLARALLALQRADAALRCCDRALALDGSMVDAHRLRGSALVALGRAEEALANLGHAVRLAPTDAAALIDLGVALASCDRPQDAVLCFKRAVELDPRQAPAHHNLGLLAARMGDNQQALESIERALALEPGNAALHINRGTTLKELGRLSDALQSYSTALEIEPRNVDATRNRAVVNLLMQNYAAAIQDYDQSLALGGERPQDLIGRGTALIGLGRHAEALPLLERAAILLPDEIDAHVQLGVALLRLERHAEAVARFDQALLLQRNHPNVLNNRGVALAALGRLEEALEDFIESAARGADNADTHTNIGVMFKSLGDHRQARYALERALALKRDDPAASFELALLHLALGEFRQGWPLYEARLRVPALALGKRDFPMPRWDGRAPLAGKTLLVHAEQGLGDTIQFARYLPLLVGQGAGVVFEVMPQLKALVASLTPDLRIVPWGEPLPPADFHCPLLSLPLAFDTQPDTIPASVPYLSSEPSRLASWASRLQGLRGLRVGIAWQGNLRVERLMWARGRSIPLSSLAPLADVAGVSLVSLQKGPGAEQLREAPFRDRILDLGPEFDAGPDAFLDSAAVMDHLDLVISTDTAVVHLAGALGRPVWVAIEAQPDWRWLLDRNDSPWYPSMRLFRQPVRNGGWDPVVANLVTALEALVSAR